MSFHAGAPLPPRAPEGATAPIGSLWVDVVFDHAAAAAAAEQCARMAALLSDAMRIRLASSDVAQVEWRGTYRTAFDDELANTTAETAQTIEALLLLAGRIAEAADEARFRQSRIDAARDEWEREERARQARASLARLDQGAGVGADQ